MAISGKAPNPSHVPVALIAYAAQSQPNCRPSFAWPTSHCKQPAGPPHTTAPACCCGRIAVLADSTVMRLGIAHHFGWAVAVTATSDHTVADRRRIELIESGVAVAPIHHEGKPLDDAAAAELVARVRASSLRAAAAGLDALAAALPEPITSMSLRAWPADFPADIVALRRIPYEARADSVMYRQVLAELAHARGWDVHTFEAKDVEAQAAELLGERADAILLGPRETLGPPWTKDHRLALAATVVAGSSGVFLDQPDGAR